MAGLGCQIVIWQCTDEIIAREGRNIQPIDRRASITRLFIMLVYISRVREGEKWRTLRIPVYYLTHGSFNNRRFSTDDSTCSCVINRWIESINKLKETRTISAGSRMKCILDE